MRVKRLHGKAELMTAFHPKQSCNAAASAAPEQLSGRGGFPILPLMPPAQLNTDVALGVAIPSRNARGRIARLASTVDTVLASHQYPPLIEQLLAEALTLTALLGALLKEPQGQLTMQAQTEGGIIDLMVCDYLGGELRGYVRHDPEKLAAAPAEPTLAYELQPTRSKNCFGAPSRGLRSLT